MGTRPVRRLCLIKGSAVAVLKFLMFFLRRSPTFTFYTVPTNYVAGPEDTDHFLQGVVSLVYDTQFFIHSRFALNVCELQLPPMNNNSIQIQLSDAHFQKSRLFLSFVDKPLANDKGH